MKLSPIPRRPAIRWPGPTPRSTPVPLARDPFVNTPLLRLTPDAAGLDRFWISSFNGAFGSLGVCVNELGEARLFPFRSYRHPGFYSAVQTGPDTLWLCGNLARVVRLDLATGTFDEFDTGAPGALVFAGMAYDRHTGKLFFTAYPPGGTVAVSFSTRALRTVRLHKLATPDHYQRSSYAHADGTCSVELQCPGLTMARWNPRTEEVALTRVAAELEAHGSGNLVYRLVTGDDGRLYMPGLGWYDPAAGKIGRGPRPADDTVTWFARDKAFAYGIKTGTALLRRWRLGTDDVSDLGEYPGTGMGFMTTALSRSGKLVSVSKDGLFTRVDARTGEMELARPLPTDSVQPADCVIRIDRDRMLGTPFITQRFWEANLRTGRGIDCGPAAPGGGEILQVWRLGGRIYMAAYTGGELMEYDPAKPARFPENPRVVAKPPTGMRPVAAADDGRRIFYACSHPYGHLGSGLTRYDTRTGLAFYRDNPLPDQQIVSLCHDAHSDTLLCGTAFSADGASVPPTSTDTFLARLDADTGRVVRKTPGPAGATATRLVGPLGRGRWLGTCSGAFADGRGLRWFAFDAARFRTPTPADLRQFEGLHDDWLGKGIQYAGRPGLFVLKVGPRIELWDMRAPRRLRILGDSPHLCAFFVQSPDVLVWTAWDVFVLEGVL